MSARHCSRQLTPGIGKRGHKCLRGWESCVERRHKLTTQSSHTPHHTVRSPLPREFADERRLSAAVAVDSEGRVRAAHSREG